MPWAFIATSMLPIVMPMKNPAMTKAGMVGARMGPKKARQNSMPVTAVSLALPKRLINTPAAGMAQTAPPAKARRARPKTAGPTSRRSFAKGICGTQAPTSMPCSKKVAFTAQRA